MALNSHFWIRTFIFYMKTLSISPCSVFKCLPSLHWSGQHLWQHSSSPYTTTTLCFDFISCSAVKTTSFTWCLQCHPSPSSAAKRCSLFSLKRSPHFFSFCCNDIIVILVTRANIYVADDEFKTEPPRPKNPPKKQPELNLNLNWKELCHPWINSGIKPQVNFTF